MNSGGTAGAVFCPVGFGDEHAAADRTAFQVLIPEKFRFQRPVQRQDCPAEPLTADRERNRLRADAGVPIVKGNAVAVLPEKVSCLVVASCVSLVSPQAAKLTRSAAPPLPTKPCGFAGAPTIAACSGVGTLPATSGHFVPKSGSLRCFPSRGIPFRTVILFSRCCPSMNYPKSTRKKCNSRNFARIAF